MNLLKCSSSNIKAVAKHIAQIHSQVYKGPQNPKTVYRRGFRELITNTQSLLPYYESMTLEDADSFWFAQQIEKAFEEYMKIMKVDQNRPCVHLHGDFHGDNIII